MDTLRQKLTWLWNNVEKLLIILFFTTFTLNIRKVFLTKYSFLNGGFNEYLTPSFTWADLLILLTIFIYIIKYLYCQFRAYYEIITVSEYKFSIKSILNPKSITHATIFLFLFFLWAGSSIFWAKFPLISWHRFATWLELLFFSVIAYKLFHEKRWQQYLLLALIANGLFQSALAIIQFLANSSIGLHFLGESLLGPNINGVAKIIILHMKHIRAYGTLPHSNILSGFLIIPQVLATNLVLVRLFSLYGRKTRGIIVSHETLSDKIPTRLAVNIWIILTLGLLVTFSRSAILSDLIAMIILVLWNMKRFHAISSTPTNQSTNNRPSFFPSLFHSFSGVAENLSRTAEKQKYCFSRRVAIFSALALVIALFTLTFVAKTYTTLFSEQSLAERKQYSAVSCEIISHHPLVGIGLGQFVFREHLKYPHLPSWQYQPVHNIYLLIASELGTIGVSLALVSLITYLGHTWREAKEKGSILTIFKYYVITISFLVISFFDHYFWDIKIGTIIFIAPILFLAIFSKNIPDSTKE
ncbi:MAG: O-antigen ligase family protein [Candidatus Moranbacteria bacterium]|nr:O-antigen ligase family protein [Candidatus Moranbacteria bacterium]